MMKYFMLDPNSIIIFFFNSRLLPLLISSSFGGNSTSSAVVKLHSVAELVGAEYIKTVSNDKLFSDWCKGIFDYFFYYFNCNPQLLAIMLLHHVDPVRSASDERGQLT